MTAERALAEAAGYLRNKARLLDDPAEAEAYEAAAREIEEKK